MTTAAWSPPSRYPGPSNAPLALPAGAMPRPSSRQRAPSRRPCSGDDDVGGELGRTGVGVVALLHRRAHVEDDVVRARRGVGVVPHRVGELAVVLCRRRPRPVLLGAVRRVDGWSGIAVEALAVAEIDVALL